MKSKLSLSLVLFLLILLVPIGFLGNFSNNDIENEVEKYKTENALVVLLTPETVEIEDRPDVEDALEAYDLLSEEAQIELIDEKTILDSLLVEIERLEAVELEVITFLTDHFIVLGLTIETVVFGDIALLDAALADYDPLSEEVQDRLTNQKTLLDSLLVRIEQLEAILAEITAFLSDYAYVLGLTIETVNIVDKSDVEAALAAFDLLSVDAQAGLTDEKVLLDSLLVEIERIEVFYDELLLYLTENSYALSLTLETVEISDKSYIELASIDYDNLSTDAQAKLLTEKALLDSLLLEIDGLEIVAAEVAMFKVNNAEALALTVETVVISNKTIVEAAIVAYDMLSVDAQANLVVEKTLLDSLIVEIERQETIVVEVTTFITNHSIVLAITTGTVVIGDQAVVDVALAAYDLLSIDAKALLTDEKALLNSLNIEIDGQISVSLEVATFITNNEYTLALTVGTMEVTDRSYVEVALSDYENLSNLAKVELTSEKALLDNLLAVITAQEAVASEVADYLMDYAYELALTVESVEINDRAIVEEGLAAYDLLSPEAETGLTTEKTLLDSLLVEIERQEAVELEVETFTTDHAIVLALTTSTVVIGDQAIIDSALDAYDLLSIDAKLELSDEKALLDSLENEIRVIPLTIELEVAIFITDHAYALALTVETVQISNKSYVEVALAAYDNLSVAVQAELTTEKALLDSLIEEIERQEEVAIEVLLFKYNYSAELALTVDTVEIEDLPFIESALYAYDLLSVDAQVELAVEKALLDSVIVEIDRNVTIQDEITGFKSDHFEALLLTVDSVTTNDLIIVEAALVVYETLSIEAKAGLTTEKTLLDGLLDEINKQLAVANEVSSFDSNHAYALSLNVESVEMTDRSFVEIALAGFDTLSIDAQAELAVEKELLDSLLTEIEVKEAVANEVALFKTDHAIALSLIVGTVQVTDRLIVEAALAAYDMLSIYTQTELATEKALSESLLAEIERQEAVASEIALYKVEHAYALSLTTETVTVLDKTIVEAAIIAYDMLSVDAQANLVVEKTLLDSLIVEIERQETIVVEVTTFITNHSIVLAITTGTVVIGDQAVVDVALAAYDLLSIDAKALLTDEKALLNSLNIEIDGQISVSLEVATFITNNEYTLALTVETVEATDRSYVEVALAAYDNLSTTAQAEISIQKALLDSLLLEIERQEAVSSEIASYIMDYAYELALTVETVDISDRPIVEVALAAYDNLSVDAQFGLTTEKSLLDSLIVEIERQEAVELEISTFTSHHSAVLALTTVTVVVGDQAIIDAALAAYDLLSIDAKAGLTAEKALLDNLANEIRLVSLTLEQEVNIFLSDHAITLALTVGTVEVTDRSYVDIALVAYDNLGTVAQAELTTEKTLLDSLLVEIERLEAVAQEIALFKTTNADALALTLEMVEISDKTILESALTQYDTLSAGAHSALVSEKALLDSLHVEIELLEVIANDVASFKTTNVYALALTVDTVEISDKTIVEDALSAFDTLPGDAQVELAVEKALLDSLVIEIERQETVITDIAAYILEHSYALALTVEAVEVTDRSYVEVALAEYNTLNIDVQAGLTTEKALLDSLLLEIERQVAVSSEIAKYKNDNAHVLALTIETVQITDRSYVEIAIVAYENLSSDASTNLTSEKALLDSLFIEIKRLEAVASEITLFKVDNASALSITVDSAVISDKVIVEAALAAYDALSNDAKLGLLSEKTLLDSFLTEIERKEAVVLEISTFMSNHFVALSLTTESVVIGDQAVIDISLVDYYILSVDAKAGLTTEKALLDSLLAQVNKQVSIQLEISTFITNNSYVLSLTVGTVEITDRSNVEVTLAAYDSLSSDAQTQLLTEKVLLDSLLVEIDAKEVVVADIGNYINDNSIALSLTVEIVEISNKDIVEAALSSYDLLSAEAQGLLTQEKALLDNLLDEIERQEVVELEISTFTANHSVVLSLTTGTVVAGNQDIIDTALAAYDLLSIDAKAGLTDEKALLDNLANEIRLIDLTLEQEVNKYLSDHAVTLAFTVGTVQITDRSYVEVALAAYDNLSVDAKTELLTEQILLDSLLVEIERQVDVANAVALYKTNNADALTLTLESVEIINKTIVQIAITQYELLTFSEKSYLVDEKILLDSLLVQIVKLESIVLEVNTFTTNYALVLDKTVLTVLISDRNMVENALNKYEILSIEAQAKLTDEKTLLDSLLLEIGRLESIASEISVFKNNNTIALTLTVESVQITDKSYVELALIDYDNLSTDAQSQLGTEKTLLDSLLVEIERLVAIELEITTFMSNNSTVLSLSTSTVQVIDKTIVEQALAEYDLLSIDAQSRLHSEKVLIDSLLIEIGRQEGIINDINTFKINKAIALSLTVETVETTDRNLVEVALAAYSNLSIDAQAGLTTEKTLLDSLIVEIERLDTVAAEVALYKTNNVEALARTVETVQITDKSYVEFALASYENLSVAAKTELTSKKVLLDSLLVEIVRLENIASEIALFKTNNAVVLSLTVDSVVVGDQAMIDVALAAYNLLSIDAKAGLTTEKALLDSLADKIRVVQLTVQQEVNKYISDHAIALALTVGTVQVTDRSYVDVAVSAYNNLSLAAKTELTTQKALLDNLLVEIVLQETLAFEVAVYKTNNTTPLALTIGTVQVTDRTIVETAISSYNLLSANAKVLLTTEKALLDSLLVEIVRQDAIAIEVALFKTNNATALTLTVGTVQITNKTIVTNAITAFNNLSVDAKSKLSIEKSLLDSLLVEIVRQETIATEVSLFETNNATALALTVGTVQITNKTIVSNAISSFNILSVEAKLKLSVEKALLDSLLVEIVRQESVAYEISKFKTDHSYPLALTVATVNISDLTYVESALNAYDLLSVSAKSGLVTEKALLDSLKVEITSQKAKLLILENFKASIITGSINGLFTNLVISEDSLIARVNAVRNTTLPLVTDTNVSVTVTYVSVGNYNITLKYVGSKVEITFPVTATFKFSQALQDKTDVTNSQSIITDYFKTNLILIKNYASDVKYDAFIAKSNYLIANNGVTLIIKNVVHRPGNNPSTFEITLIKNNEKVTFIVQVDYKVSNGYN